MVQFVECIDNNVAHSAVVALRNLAEDIQNKKTIGKYGMQAIVAKVNYHGVMNLVKSYDRLKDEKLFCLKFSSPEVQKI